MKAQQQPYRNAVNAVEAHDLVKRYERVEALRGVSFEVPHGEIFGIIGPDGAGKTTLFRILTTLILADTGTATVEGFDVVQDYMHIRSQVGYMPGRFSLYQDLTVEENLTFFATVFNTSIEENYALIEDIYKQLEPFKTRRAGKLSGGMKQKLALCCALIHRPPILFLDEPTTGVDPVSRKEFWDMLQKLKDQGITILVSTPYMDEAGLCDRIALMLDGRFMEIDTPENIIARFTDPLLAVSGSGMYQMLAVLRAHPGVVSCYAFGNVHHVTLKDPSVTPQMLKTYLEQHGHSDVQIRPTRPGIEDCYMKLAQNKTL